MGLRARPNNNDVQQRQKRSQMPRKMILALAASATLGAAALAPNSASAYWGGHGGWGNRPFVQVYAGPVYYGGGCMVRRWLYTPYRPAWRWVNRCY
jgi:hypothetical protein